MMRVAVWGNDLADGYLLTVTQLGAEAIDMGRGAFFPGVREQGYPDADALAALVRKLRPYGLRFNRVTLPDRTEEFMLGGDGCLNPDHLQSIEGDGDSAYQALAYSVGYLKALLAALAA